MVKNKQKTPSVPNLFLKSFVGTKVLYEIEPYMIFLFFSFLSLIKLS